LSYINMCFLHNVLVATTESKLKFHLKFINVHFHGYTVLLYFLYLHSLMKRKLKENESVEGKFQSLNLQLWGGRK
jgi:hypothetical protein